MTRPDERPHERPDERPDDQVAAALSRALRHDAESVQPGDRLPQLRERAAARRPVWVTSLAAAAAVAAVAGAGVVAVQVLGSDHRTAPPAGSTTSRGGASSTSAPAPTTGRSTPPSPTSSSPSSVASPGPTTAVPVYYLGPDGDRPALFREFHRVAVQPGVSTLQQALDAATDGRTVVDPDLSSPWGELAGGPDVRRTGAHEVTIDLPASTGQANGRTSLEARLAVQQLVWTASAVTRDAGLGVRVLIAGGPGRLFGLEPVGDVVHRATPSYTVLGSVWVEQPGEGQQVSSPVTVSGSACVFEATVAWELARQGATVSSGHTTATTGCPQRGTWTVRLGRLPAGTYTFRAYEPPASGSGPDRQDTRTFVVR